MSESKRTAGQQARRTTAARRGLYDALHDHRLKPRVLGHDRRVRHERVKVRLRDLREPELRLRVVGGERDDGRQRRRCRWCACAAAATIRPCARRRKAPVSALRPAEPAQVRRRECRGRSGARAHAFQRRARLRATARIGIHAAKTRRRR